jgi:queuine/archaeosine tRNA-ribosyltransferase
VLRVIGSGIDMFNFVLPTRTARTGSALTATGRRNLRNPRFAVLLELTAGARAALERGELGRRARAMPVL